MELFDGYWIQLVLKTVGVLLVVLTGALVVIYAELKIGSHMQSRIGPYYAGGRWGWAQPLADGLKFLQKEDLAPTGADRTVYGYAPYVVLMATIGVAMCGVYAVTYDMIVFLDVAVVMALITFVGTVAFSKFLTRGDIIE